MYEHNCWELCRASSHLTIRFKAFEDIMKPRSTTSLKLVPHCRCFPMTSTKFFRPAFLEHIHTHPYILPPELKNITAIDLKRGCEECFGNCNQQV